MTNFTVRNLKQKAVYWGDPRTDGHGGYTYADPVEIDCRWVDSGVLITDSKGVNHVSQAEVQVDQDLDIEGMLKLSLLVDIDSADWNNPEKSGAVRIKRFDKTPTMNGRYHFMKAYCI